MFGTSQDDQYRPRINDFFFPFDHVLDSIVVSILACHAGVRGSILQRGDFFLLLESKIKYSRLNFMT